MSTLEIIPYKEKQYELLCKWFKQWDNWTPIPPQGIPDTSFLLMDGDKPVMFSCYYESNSCFAQMGFTIRDRDAKVSEDATNMLIEHIKKEAVGKGYAALYYTTDKSSKYFVDKFVECGGIVTDTDAFISYMPLDGKRIDFIECEQ